MEVMKQLRQRAIRDLVDQRPIRTQQELAAALRERGFRTTQATISRDVAELGLIKVARDGTVGLRPAAAPDRGRDIRRGSPARSCFADLPLEVHEAGLLLVAAHAAGVRACRSRPRSIAPAGRRSPARSPATTRSSSRSPIAGRSQRVQAAACSDWPTATLTGATPPTALTPAAARVYHSRPVELQARGTPRQAWSSFLYPADRRPVAASRPPALRGPPAVNNKPTYLSQGGPREAPRGARRDGLASSAPRSPTGSTTPRNTATCRRTPSTRTPRTSRRSSRAGSRRSRRSSRTPRSSTSTTRPTTSRSARPWRSRARDGKETFTIVGSTEAKPAEGRISQREPGRSRPARQEEGREGRRQGPGRRLHVQDRRHQPDRAAGPPGRHEAVPATGSRPWTGRTNSRPVRDRGPQVVNDSKTPSGTVHVGSLRGPVILDDDHPRAARERASRRRCCTASTTSIRWMPRRS